MSSSTSDVDQCRRQIGRLGRPTQVEGKRPVEVAAREDPTVWAKLCFQSHLEEDQVDEEAVAMDRDNPFEKDSTAAEIGSVGGTFWAP